MRIPAKTSEIAMLLMVSLMSFGANIPESLIPAFIDRKLLLMTLTVSVIIALFRYLRFMVFMAVAILAIGANVPGELAQQFGIEPTILLVSLALIVALSLLNYVAKILPTGLEKRGGIDTLHSRQNLLTAVCRGDVGLVQRLLSMNVEVNFQQHGETPILMAADKGYADIVQILLHHGANFKVRNKAGQTPMDIALVKGYTRTAQILHHAAGSASGKRPASAEIKNLTNMFAPAA